MYPAVNPAIKESAIEGKESEEDGRDGGVLANAWHGVLCMGRPNLMTMLFLIHVHLGLCRFCG